ncbi:hypothetical protein FSARC_12358 [Fusarium sarcochroum]|uniref:Clock-controlled pheromone ccg-4 n=1 Tax=Fusarium sarcochroum TaxID=1208366 RepID=A0A8H4T8W2_9HYPO|nr:hypothetical protein FSARC_12358 [Fusarium sarcochroum]
MKFTLATLAVFAATGLAAPSADPVAAPKPNPVSEPEPWCTWVGQSCWKAKRDVGEVKRDAAPEPEPWCMWVGQSCWKVKRDAGEALSSALHTTRSIDIPSVNPRSISDAAQINAAHQAKRSVVELANMVALSARGSSEEYFKSLNLEEHFPDYTSGGHAKGEEKTLQSKREATPGKPRQCYEMRWCMCVGQSCWKAKRAAEAVLATIDARDAGSDDSHFDARSFSAESFAAKRDIMAIKAAARSIIDANKE